MKQCSFKNCKLKIFENEDKCIFHCNKISWVLGDDDTNKPYGSYYTKKWDSDKIDCFWNQLYRYVNYLVKLENREYRRKRSSVAIYNSRYNFSSCAFTISRTNIGDEKEGTNIFLQEIKFPPSHQKSAAHFFELDFPLVKRIYFQQCIFYDNFTGASAGIYDLKVSLEFQNSNFKGDMYFYRFDGTYNSIRIIDCIVEGNIVFYSQINKISIENTKVNAVVINSNTGMCTRLILSPTIKQIVLKENNVNQIHIYNKVTIEEMKIIDSKIKMDCIIIDRANIGNMVLRNINVRQLTFKNVDFIEDAKIILKQLNLEYFTLRRVFQNTQFIILENVTVNKNFRCNKMNFKNTSFNSLNVQNSKIFLRDVSFVDAHINRLNWGNIENIKASRDIFRSIKYAYDKEVNFIEANKFYAMEMKKHKVELIHKPLKGHLQEKFIFWINDKMSNFGQSFLRPIGFIALFSFIYGLIIYGNEHNWLMSIYPKGGEYLNTIVHWLNYPLKEFRPLEKILKKDYEFMSLIFNVIFSVLIWQTIVAVKRYTKR